MFFCLSGFTLFLVYGSKPLNLTGFYIARFARIYPLFILVLSVAVFYTWRLGWFHAYSRSAVIELTIKQALLLNALPFVGTGGFWLPPMWSLSIEAFCYVALFPALYFLIKFIPKISFKKNILAIITLTFATYVVYILWYNPQINSPSTPLHAVMPHFVAIIRGICMFSSGWLAWIIYKFYPEISSQISGYADLIIIGAILIIVGQGLSILNGYIIVVLAPFIILSNSGGTSLSVRFFSSTPLHYLGLISYSLYLWHWPVFTLFPVIFHGMGKRPEFLLDILTSLMIASASYYFFEKPMRRWTKIILSKFFVKNA